MSPSGRLRGHSAFRRSAPVLLKDEPEGFSPEVAFCARLAENVGIVKHAIVKLRHAGYVEE